MQLLTRNNGWTIAFSERSDGNFRGTESDFLEIATAPVTHSFSCLRVEHGSQVAHVGNEEQPQFLTADALLGRSPQTIFGLSVGDCLPIVMMDKTSSAGGIVHGGWRSLADGIMEKSVEELLRVYGTRPENLELWIGPSIRGNSYRFDDHPKQLGDPLWQTALRQQEQSWSVDLHLFVLESAKRLGLSEDQVIDSELDTFTFPRRFFSHRRATETGNNDDDGRMVVLAWRTE